MKVEDFAELIIQHVAEHQCCLQDQWATLEKMRQSTNQTHVKNYWRVTQAVAECGMTLLERRMFLDPFYMRFTSVHMFCYAGCTTAVLRRLLKCGETLFRQLKEVLQELDHVQEFHDNAQAALTLIFRCLLVAKPKDTALVVKFGIVNDAYTLSKKILSLDPKGREFADVRVVIAATTLLEFLAETGSSEVHKHLKKQEHAFNRLIRKVPQHFNPSNFSDPSEKKQVSNMLNYASIYCSLLEGREDKSRGFSTMSKSQRLAREVGSKYFVFCSLPDCRKEEHADGVLMHCSACMLARYCDVECQKQHWDQGHKLQCQIPSPYLPCQ